MTALRQIKPPDALIYIVAQLAGAVAGALLTKALLEDEGRAVNYGATVVSAQLNGDIFPGMVVEALGTFFLVWVIVGVAVNPRATKEWAALAIGAALGMAVMVLAPLTGAGFNPARSFGPAIVSGEWSGGAADFLLVYVAGADHRSARRRARLPPPGHRAGAEGRRRRGAGRLADQTTNATIEAPAMKSVKIVAYQNAGMSGEPYTKCSGVINPVSE